MQRKNSIWQGLDWPTVFIYLILVFMGWANIYAAVYSEEHSSIFDFTQRYGMQLVWIGAAVVLALLVMAMDSRFYFVFANFIYAAMIMLLVTALLFGTEVNGSRSWIQMGPIRIQPAEFAKFATALALAKLMSKYGFKIHQFKSIATIAFLVITPALLILLQNDTGSALVYSSFILVLYREGLTGWILVFMVFMVLLFILVLVYNIPVILMLLFALTLFLFVFISGRYRDAIRFGVGIIGIGVVIYGASEFFNLNLSWHYFLLLPLVVGIPIAIVYAFINRLRYIYLLVLFTLTGIFFSFSVDYVFHNILDTHHQKRINDLLGIESDPLGWGYNVNQSKIAIGSGGFWGKGYLKGTQTKFNFVPEQSTDFIFCTVGEEWGFVGTTVVVALFLMLLIRIIRVAERQRESFARIYGYGVASILFFHIAVNIGMTIGLFPVIGIPLPFFSYGGSSLWAFTVLLFILLKLDSTRLG
ncbi:MAG: rod shape-determining protein RodA [Bacteroidales bacterium]|nr:rod shape-determining protein RodA [Bacteroidales bacterium]MBN2749660.1 rod shape-determining protein RodA [Bacteroidales bacterium]